MNKIIKFLFPALLICCWGCSSDSKEEIIPTPEPENTKIEITSNQPVMEQTGGTATVSFTTNAAWTASVSATTTWITVSPASGGKGTHTLTVTTVENDTYDERNASVTIKAGNVSKNFTVTQKQKNALTVTSNKVELEAEGGEFSIEVKANVDVSYKIEEAAKEWIMESKSRGLSTTTLMFKSKNNESEETRQATITLKGGDNLTETVTVYQAGKEKEILLLTQKEYTVDSEGDTLTVELKSNTEYEMVWPEVDWVSEASSRAVSSYTHYIAVAPNETYSHRKTQIVFRSKTSEMVDTLSIFQSGKEKKHYSTPQNDRDALVILFDAMNGKEWNNQTNWGSNKPLNEWYGVETDTEGNVTQLYLWYNNLSGYIPDEIGYLKNLTHLVLSGNYSLEGELPDALFTLPNLEDLCLDNTKCTGNMSQICQLKNLSYIDLSNSSITGPIPEEINQLTNLGYLHLQGSHIGGCIPETIGELPSLSHMYIASCQLEGRIPESIGNMPELRVIGFDNNNLTGNIPRRMFYAPKLEYIGLNNNQLEGNIPDEIANLKNVWCFTTHSNPNLTSLPQSTSLLQLPCWPYSWWVMIHDTGIKAPIEEEIIPGPFFRVIDFKGDSIIANEEYKKNRHTILVQWNPTEEKSQNVIPTVVSLYKKYANKGLGVIGWCIGAEDKMEQIEDYISKEQITWRNFNSSGENNIYRVYSEYPIGASGFTLHVVNSNRRVVFSSLVSDVDTLSDFIEKALAE